MTLLRNHEWLVGMLVLFVNVIIGRVRMSPLIADGKLTVQEANRFRMRLLEQQFLVVREFRLHEAVDNRLK